MPCPSLQYKQEEAYLSFLSEMLLRRLNDPKGRVRYCGQFRATIEFGQILFEATKLEEGVLLHFRYAGGELDNRIARRFSENTLDENSAEEYAEKVFERLVYTEFAELDKENYLKVYAEQKGYQGTTRLASDRKTVERTAEEK